MAIATPDEPFNGDELLTFGGLPVTRAELKQARRATKTASPEDHPVAGSFRAAAV